MCPIFLLGNLENSLFPWHFETVTIIPYNPIYGQQALFPCARFSANCCWYKGRQTGPPPRGFPGPAGVSCGNTADRDSYHSKGRSRCLAVQVRRASRLGGETPGRLTGKSPQVFFWTYKVTWCIREDGVRLERVFQEEGHFANAQRCETRHTKAWYG